MYEPKFATYSANSPDPTSQITTAVRPPGDTQRKPPWRAFGAAQYRIAKTTLMITASTGHLA